MPSGLRTALLVNQRRRFMAQIRAVAPDIKLLMLPTMDDILTSADESGRGHVLTHSATAAGRLTAQGNGALLSYASASSQYTDTPDAADLSFGDGATDQAFTVAWFGVVTDTAAERCLISKFNTVGSREYRFGVLGTDALVFLIADESVPAQPFVLSDAAITMGSPVLLVGTYSGVGGANAHLGLALYQNDAAVASTATAVATYVAMENLGPALEIGSRTAHTANFLDGSTGMALVAGGAMSAANVSALYAACRRFFGV